MVNRKAGSQIGSLTFDHLKSGINPISLRAGGVPHSIGKILMRGTTFLKLHLDWRFAHKIMGLQNGGSLDFGNFGTPTWSPGTRSHLDVGLVERQKIYYKKEGGGFPQVWAMVSFVSPSCPWFVLTPKVLQLCTKHLCWFCASPCE